MKNGIRTKSAGQKIAGPLSWKMNTQQLLTKIREFATENYCSCDGRIHDPENLMEKLLKECDKWEKEAKNET